jgi:hypothetical protein
VHRPTNGQASANTAAVARVVLDHPGGKDLPCRARPADPVPGRGGPERRRRPRPDGTGTLDAHEIAHGTRHDTPG